MNNSSSAETYSARVKAAWEKSDPNSDYWHLPADIVALIFDDLAAKLEPSLLQRFLEVNNCETVTELRAKVMRLAGDRE